ncbi:MAG: hypothetical protein JWR38_4312 [Mucilaginibacter sp.]|nr:hypothetical protein [Mucilaginibacter sp.]
MHDLAFVKNHGSLQEFRIINWFDGCYFVIWLLSVTILSGLPL